MSRRHGLVLACALGLGCTPATDAPVPAPPPGEPRVVLDASGDPTHGDAPAPNSEPEPGGSAPAVAPQSVSGEINEPYNESTDPKGWVARFEREGREAFDHRDEIIAALELQPGQRIADVGAGTGLFTLALAEVVGPQGRVYAVDVQPYFLDHIRQKAKKAGADHVEVVRAQQDSVGLSAASVDLVLMCDSYHHVEQPAAYLESLRQAIEPGGRLVVVDYRAVEGQSRQWLVEHVRATPEQFRAEIEGAGFRFVREHEGLLEENFFYEFRRP